MGLVKEWMGGGESGIEVKGEINYGRQRGDKSEIGKITGMVADMPAMYRLRKSVL